jgi:hypothetical protein
MERWLVKNKEQADFFIRFIKQEVEEGRERYYSVVRANRTNKQSNALHLLFRQMAEELNAAGYTRPHPWGKMEIPYSEVAVKEIFYLPIIDKVFGKQHSSDLNTKELSESVDILLDALAQNTGIAMQMPQQASNISLGGSQ